MALHVIVPSSQRHSDVLVEQRPVSWEDIGGLAEVKLQLQQVRHCSVINHGHMYIYIISVINHGHMYIYIISVINHGHMYIYIISACLMLCPAENKYFIFLEFGYTIFMQQ